MEKRMVVTDLDGTLAIKGVVSDRAKETLTELGKRSIPRVVATGRTLHSARRFLGDDFPIDYLVFSSGAGIFDLQEKTVIRASQMPAEDVQPIATLLIQHGYDFMVHDPIPENHLFTFAHSETPPPDFLRRLERNRTFSRPLKSLANSATQFLVVLPPGGAVDGFSKLTSLLPRQSVIRATSPLDGESAWIEIFPRGVCKSEACEWLCRLHEVAPSNVLAVGNDYNDIDLLRWAGTACLAEPSPVELAREFKTLEGAGSDCFSEAVRRWLAPLT